MLNLGTLPAPNFPCGDTFISCTKDSGWGYVRGFSRIVFTTEKIAVFAPIPTASTMIAITVKPGVLASDRSAKRKSRHASSIQSVLVKIAKRPTRESIRIMDASLKLWLGHYQKVQL